MASSHQKGHLVACHRGPVEREGAEGGSVLVHGPSPALPSASSRNDPFEEGAGGSAQTEGQSVNHERAASCGSQGNGCGGNSDHLTQLSCEGSLVHSTTPSLSDA